MSDNIIATWTIHLFCDCPQCKDSVDLLDHPEFWLDNTIDVGEHYTDKTRGMEVMCPDCGHEFKVDLEF
jgi:uncharacterized Zn-finger protein